MAGTYSNIGVVTPIANIVTALTAKYGAYNDPANLNGYREHDNSAEYLLFECAAIAGNRFIRLRWTSTNMQHQWGTARTGANALTNPLDWGGIYATSSTMTHIHLVLHDDAYFMCCTNSTPIRASEKTIVLGELSNGEFGCGAYTSNGGLYTAAGILTGITMYNMTQNIQCQPYPLPNILYTAGGNIYKQNIVMVSQADNKMMVDGVGDPIVFNNVYNTGHNGAVEAPIVGANFLMGGGRMSYTNTPAGPGSNPVYGHSSWMAEYTPAP